MPVRKRRRRSRQDALSMADHVALTIGRVPLDDPAEFARLREVFRRHWQAFSESDWAWTGFDDSVSLVERGLVPVGGSEPSSAGLSGVELDRAVGLPGV